LKDRPTAALILGAGRGKRLISISPPFLKPLLLVNELPAIGYAARAVEPHVDRIILVTHPTTATKVYEATAGSLKNNSIEIELTTQRHPLGMADAMRVGFKALEEDHAVVVLAGDNIILDDRNVKNTLALVRTAENNTEHSKLAWTFQELPHGEARRFSVYKNLGEGKGKLIEKPDIPPSMICWCGPVAFSSSIEALHRIKTLTPSSRGEYEATDLMNTYLINGESSHIRLLGKWFDIGTPESLEEARKKISLPNGPTNRVF
jgi:dTDP-glucose pyrophosphorylase